MKRRLIVFTRYPEAGLCKTRLIPTLGAEGAATLHRQLAARTLETASRLPASQIAELHVEFAGRDTAAMRAEFGEQFDFREQASGDLGARLSQAFQAVFLEGAKRVVVVGTDCPDLTADLLETAFRLLDSHDVVIGPACDGGYYLIGLSNPQPAMFSNMPWSSSELLSRTLQAADNCDLQTALLPTLTDVDRPEDIPVWERVGVEGKSKQKPHELSIIIPTLDTEPELETTIQSALQNDSVELIIAAAGQTNHSRSLATRYGCTFIRSPAQRARQMNAGAAVASGQSLLFLHADTRLPSGYAQMVETVLSQSRVMGGAFPLTIDARGLKYRLVERAVQLRSRFRQLPYGDQAIFLRRTLFQELRGFREWPIMEDYELVQRLRKQGRIGLATRPAVTSARRWRKLGVVRTTCINQIVIVGYKCGVPAEKLAGWYRPTQR